MRSRPLVVTMLAALALPAVHPAPSGAQPRPGFPAPDPPQATATAGDVILPQAALQLSRPVRHLSVDEAVTLALEQYLDLRVERINPLIQDTAVAEARSVYAPTCRRRSPATSGTAPPAASSMAATW